MKSTVPGDKNQNKMALLVDLTSRKVEINKNTVARNSIQSLRIRLYVLRIRENSLSIPVLRAY